MPASEVIRLRSVARLEVAVLLDRYGLELRLVADNETPPGSYWGESEAGLRGRQLFARLDTPVHSILHEASHFVCVTPERRVGMDTDAGGDFEEENGVCYLQILLADFVPQLGRDRMLADMDSWGYTFRLGSARAWFESDAADTRAWLLRHGLITGRDEPTWKLREQ
ncbi:MAG TPA: hypothetical protein VE046_11390 [Steroidobacteraceae bacterium]|nr:hypothetical protein [Steroidobacteraceae bacterium]